MSDTMLFVAACYCMASGIFVIGSLVWSFIKFLISKIRKKPEKAVEAVSEPVSE